MEKVFINKEVCVLADEIAKEFANRNLIPLRDFMTLANPTHTNELSRKCVALYQMTKDIIVSENLVETVRSSTQNPEWLKTALFFSERNGSFNEDTFILHVCIQALIRAVPDIDHHISHLEDTTLHESLSITVDDDLLVSLSDKRLELKIHGIIFEKETLLYPHQFLRRYYSGNFVGLPALLRKAHDTGAEVSIRIDPLRKTAANYYQEIREFDHWYGEPFSRQILEDKITAGRTLHRSRGYTNFGYDPRYTVFRTKMMDKGQREFMIEEYCPVSLRPNQKHPGVGGRLCIQKFAHVSYDQARGSFSHLDGAVRVFEKEEYENYFEKIKSGSDIDEKVGIRHKLFLMEGNLSMDMVQEILVEWFRCNPHITEYFTGTTIEPEISYEDFERIAAGKV